MSATEIKLNIWIDVIVHNWEHELMYLIITSGVLPSRDCEQDTACLLPFVPWSDLIVNSDDIIGHGGSGVVFQGICRYEAAAVKVFVGDHSLAEACSEAKVYQVMTG